MPDSGFVLDAHIIFDWEALCDGTSECHFISVFEVATKGDAARDGSDTNGSILELTGDVIDRGIALDIRTECHDQLFRSFVADPVDQGVDIQLVGPYPIQRRKDAIQNVVEATELLCTFYGDDIAQVFDHTYLSAVSSRVAADTAYRSVGDIVATGAKLKIVAQSGERAGELIYLIFLEPEQMQDHPQRCFFTYTRQSGEFLDCILDQLRREDHYNTIEITEKEGKNTNCGVY